MATGVDYLFSPFFPDQHASASLYTQSTSDVPQIASGGPVYS